MRTKYEKMAAAIEEKRRATSAAVAAVQAGGRKRRITDYLEGDASAAKRDAHKGLALMFAACRIPEVTMDHPLFINAMLLVNHAGNGYVPPRRTFIGGAGLVAVRKGIEQGLVGIKSSWKKTGVTIASDMMTDKCGRAQANVLLINDSGAVFREAIDCGMERKTGGYIVGILQPVVEEVPCATHVMDLLLEDVGKMGWAKGVVDRTGEMSSFVRNHHWTRAYPRIKELVEGKVLQPLKPAGTRFGTQYIVVSRLCQLRSTLNAMVLTDRWKEWASGSRKETAEAFAARVLDDAWWRTAEFFCKLMQLPYKAMRQTVADANGMMGRLYDVMLQLTEDVNNILDEDEQQLSSADKEKIRNIIKDRWDNNLACAMHVAGRILNPANQEEDIFGSDAECTRVFKALINQHVEFLIGHDGKGRDEGPDYLLAL
ncbi:unnamed protein product, partial [Closterium sp. NIES-64]